MNYYNDLKGSIWRKWDLQVHTPFTKLYDGYSVPAGQDVWDKFCDEIEKSDVEVFGITDYFSEKNFFIFLEKFKARCPSSKKVFFLNIELRLNESVNVALEEININLIFNPESQDKANKFLQKLEVIKTGNDQAPICCSDLITQSDFEAACVTREKIEKACIETFGKKALCQDHFLIFTAANNDGVRPQRGQARKAAITDEVDKFSDAFFGGIQNQKYFLNIDRLEDKSQIILEKAIVSTSDSHSFEDLEKYLGKRFFIKDTEEKEIILKDVTWIKADPTFEGLKQIIYEPKPGERVWIGSVKPDQKDDYKIIRKILFETAKDFPTEVKFNENLCSIIGSRSSGKSALLAYIAHSIDKKITEERIPDGPGAGFPWNKIDFNYQIEWANGLTNEKSPGDIIYVPQNYLFEISKNAEEVKNKIEPVFFKLLPEFKNQYNNALRAIKTHLINIGQAVDNWFFYAEKISDLDLKLKSVGDKKAIEQELEKINTEIDAIKKTSLLTEEDVTKYKTVSENIKVWESQIQSINDELNQLPINAENPDYFDSMSLNFNPSLETLPDRLFKEISVKIISHKSTILVDLNKIVLDYRSGLEQNKTAYIQKIETEKNVNQELFKNYEKNAELQILVESWNRQNSQLKKLEDVQAEKEVNEKAIEECQKEIITEIKKRVSVFERLKSYLCSLSQDDFSIIFGMEYGFDEESINSVSKKINIRDKSPFIEDGYLNIDQIRQNSTDFLQKIYSGEQKINAGHNKKMVSQEALQLSEKILFTAEMEGDKIGGFTKSTMTPGKQALFALELILGESEDTWPLLIDQPEDDLDSRSIYDRIVPFLKNKKKERQIIMVSHNANLVIGADSEQIIVANRNGIDRPNEDKKEFNYLTGSIENTKIKDKKNKDTLKAQGIREHACDILDGGKAAFEQRSNKYNLKRK